MARGDYVQTYAGALAQGAASTVLNALAQGQSPGAMLRERFPSLPGNVLGALVTNLSRTDTVHAQTARARDTARASGVDSSRIVVVPNLLVQAEYTVIYTIVTAAGEELKLPIVVQNLPAGSSEGQILAAAAAPAMMLTAELNPRCAEIIVEGQAPGTQIESVEIVRIRIRA